MSMLIDHGSFIAGETTAGTAVAVNGRVTEAAAKPRRSMKPLAIILLAGVVVRLLLCVWFYDKPCRIWDENDYKTLAVNLLRHGEFSFTPGSPTSLRPPLYPALVAGAYALFGEENML